MTLEHDASAAGVALTAFIAWTGMVGWIWTVRNTAVNARDDLADFRQATKEVHDALEARLAKSEETTSAVRELAAAVRHGGEMTAAEIKNLTDRFREHAADTKEQLGEVKAEQRNVRIALAKRQAPPKTPH